MQKLDVYIVTIHDQKDPGLAFDLKEILAALGEAIWQWTWWVAQLETLGPDSRTLDKAVQAGEESGVWLSSQELLEWAGTIRQTIQGELLAFPRAVDPAEIDSDDLDLRFFPTNRMQLAIVGVDSSFFEIYVKDEHLLEPLRCRFQDVRLQDAEVYFG